MCQSFENPAQFPKFLTRIFSLFCFRPSFKDHQNRVSESARVQIQQPASCVSTTVIYAIGSICEHKGISTNFFHNVTVST